MREEISAAVTFLTRLVGKNEDISTDQVEFFQHSLHSVLTERFKNHWFPEKPFKGQAYRCIRVNETERRDPVLERAAAMCGLRYENLNLPVELTIWVDPQEVCCRFGEHEGSYCTVASFKDSNKENCMDQIEIEEMHRKLPLVNQETTDCLKRQKSRRKKLMSSRNSIGQQNVLKGLPSRFLLNPRGMNTRHPSSFQWNTAPLIMPPRVSRPTAQSSHDMYFSRRPRKQVLCSSLNDKYHWARK